MYTWEIFRTTTLCRCFEKHIQVYKIFKDLKKRKNYVYVFLEIYVDIKYGYIGNKRYIARKNNFFRLVRENVIKRRKRKIIKTCIRGETSDITIFLFLSRHIIFSTLNAFPSLFVNPCSLSSSLLR